MATTLFTKLNNVNMTPQYVLYSSCSFSDKVSVHKCHFMPIFTEEERIEWHSGGFLQL